jgi:hypothetical protein
MGFLGKLLDFNEYVHKCAATRPVRPNRSTPSHSILEDLTFGPAGHHGNHREEKKGKCGSKFSFTKK